MYRVDSIFQKVSILSLPRNHIHTHTYTHIHTNSHTFIQKYGLSKMRPVRISTRTKHSRDPESTAPE